MSSQEHFRLRPQQRNVVDNIYGRCFVAAGAGSGKTRVIRAAFAKALSDGITIDQILAITFTEKAAGEMARHIRDDLKQMGMKDARRQIQDAQISTIHGFCAALIRKHAFALGIDPQFGVLDEAHSRLLKEKAFTISLERLVAGGGDDAVKLHLATDASLYEGITSLYERLRSRGQREPHFEKPQISMQEIDRQRRALLEAVPAVSRALRDSGSKATGTFMSFDAIVAALNDNVDRFNVKLLRSYKFSRSCKSEVLPLIDSLIDQVQGYTNLVASYGQIPVLELLNRLLLDFGREYQRCKGERSVMDFEDLQLEAYRLLTDNPELRDAIAQSYKLVMVDEFQDTSKLQCDVIDAISNNNLIVVGDQNQCIYCFRNADIELFQERQAAVASSEFFPIQDNFRSQKEILDFVQHVFKRPEMLGESFLDLESRADPDARTASPRVDVILIDESGEEERTAGTDECVRAEAALIAERLQELCGEGGPYGYGDAAILLRNRTHAAKYKDALDRTGIPNYQTTGIGFYGKMELDEAIALLRLLVNPLDDLALITMLRSALVEISDDTLVELRRLSGGRGGKSSRTGRQGFAGPPPLWKTVRSRQSRERLSGSEDAARLERFAAELEEMRSEALRQPLESTVRSVVGYRDYAAVVAAASGKMAYANLMKLQDKAREYESSLGRDLPGFVEFLQRQKTSEAKESEAPTQGESAGAVRILTIHSAKGLEFPVVVWGNMGSLRKNNKPMLLVGKDGRVGLHYKPLAEKMQSFFDYDELLASQYETELNEEKRLAYVAMTRAKGHLILTGKSKLGDEPGGYESWQPVEWLRSALGLDPAGLASMALAQASAKAAPWVNAAAQGEMGASVENLAAQGLVAGPVVHTIAEGLSVNVTTCFKPWGIEPPAPLAPAQSSEALAVNADIDRLPALPRFVPLVISPTGLDAVRHCRFRYYLEKVTGVANVISNMAESVKETTGDRGRTTTKLEAGQHSPWGGTLSYLQMGKLLHRVLETTEFPIPETIAGGLDDSARRVLAERDEANGEYASKPPLLSEPDREHVLALLRRFGESKAAGEIGAAYSAGTLSREQTFSLGFGETVISGAIDALCVNRERVLVVDYKTGAAGAEGSLAEILESYRMQMSAYALAAGSMHPDRPIEVALLFISPEGAQEQRRVYQPGQLSSVKDDISVCLEQIVAGRFPWLDSFHARYCPACAANASPGLCPTAARTGAK